jgi:hypothetical protein
MKTCSKCKCINFNNIENCTQCGSPLNNALDIVTPEPSDVSHNILNQLIELNAKVVHFESKIVDISRKIDVTVSDINMSFESMVKFMVKWAIAAIPAAIILFLIGTVLFIIFGGLFMGLIHR